MIKKKPKEDALDAFIGKVAAIEAMLERLKEANDVHYNTHPDHIHWGHVGDVGHIEETLKRLCDSVFKEGEHAPENKA